MRALIIHPNNDYNCGDLLTYLGSKSLLTNACGGSRYLDVVQFDMPRAIAESDTYTSQYNWGPIDIIALAGSPWLWEACEKTLKYKILTDAIKRYPRAIKVALGLGSCFSRKSYECLRFDPDNHILFNNSSRERLNNIFSKFDYILVRDKLAQFIFTKLGIKSIYSYDTSLYAYHFFESLINSNVQRRKKVLFFYDVSKGISKNALDFYALDYIHYQVDWAKKHNADIYVNSTGDKDTLDSLGVKSTFSVDLQFLYSKFFEYEEMLTGRVHMGVLGFLSRIPQITLLPVDTRFMTTLKLGVKIKFIGEKYKDFPVEVSRDILENIKYEEQKIINSLKVKLT